MIEVGQVYGIKSGKYFVKTSCVKECTAKGSLKIKADGILTGDFVKIENGLLTEVLPRKNRLKRPSVANVDVAVVVIADLPKPDYYLTDKFLSYCYLNDIPTAIVVNKSDEDDKTIDVVRKNYDSFVDSIFFVSAKTGFGIQDFTDKIKGKLVVLTGQSAVGKTSIVNAVFGDYRQTGDVSLKTGRGKQTTTCSEIVESDGLKIIDTPGFSAFDLELTKEEMPKAYAEFKKFNCRFPDCKHLEEPDCGVRAAVGSGEIYKDRYVRYLEMINNAKVGKYGKKTRG